MFNQIVKSILKSVWECLQIKHENLIEMAIKDKIANERHPCHQISSEVDFSLFAADN